MPQPLAFKHCHAKMEAMSSDASQPNPFWRNTGLHDDDLFAKQTVAANAKSSVSVEAASTGINASGHNGSPEHLTLMDTFICKQAAYLPAFATTVSRNVTPFRRLVRQAALQLGANTKRAIKTHMAKANAEAVAETLPKARTTAKATAKATARAKGKDTAKVAAKAKSEYQIACDGFTGSRMEWIFSAERQAVVNQMNVTEISKRKFQCWRPDLFRRSDDGKTWELLP